MVTPSRIRLCSFLRARIFFVKCAFSDKSLYILPEKLLALIFLVHLAKLDF